MDAPKSEAEAAALLRDLKCRRWWRFRIRRFLYQPWLFFLFALVLIVAAVLTGPKLGPMSNQIGANNWVGAFGHLIVALSILLGISKWNASLEQDAMKQYEAEIAASNKAEEPDAVSKMMKHLYQPPEGLELDYEKSRYVYVQLDNLEYALERYTQGHVSAYTTARAVMTFASRCRSEEFKKRARKQVRDASYSPVVINVVERI